MNQEDSIRITGEIASVIAGQSPYIDYTAKEIEEAKRALSCEQTAELKKKGYLKYDFELYYIVDQFAQALRLYNKADESYLRRLFENARKFTPSEFLKDPYIKHVKVKETRIGDYLLTNATYSRGEFFQYAMPDVTAELIVPKIGFFTGEVAFPTIYEGNIPWMSACPSEISSMKNAMEAAYGKVLVLGLGLGYYPYVVANKEEVEEVTIVEIQPEIIRLFRENIFPQFPHKEKIKVIRADAFSYLAKVKDGEYDYCFADIWEGQQDGAECYLRLKPFEEALPNTRFDYWIEKEILWYLQRT